MPLTPNVGTGAIIQTTWGNDIRDRTVQIFTNKADLDAQWSTAPDGAHAYTIAERLDWTRQGGAWTADFPRGELGYAERTTSAGPVTASVGLGLSVSATVVANRRIRISCFVSNVSSTVVGDVFNMAIKESAVYLTQANISIATAGLGQTGAMCARTYVPAAGARTWSVDAARIAGSGSGTFTASATAPMFLQVEDVGGV